MGRKAREKWEAKLAALVSVADGKVRPAHVQHGSAAEGIAVIASVLVSVAGLRSDDLLTVIPCLTGAAVGFSYVCVKRIASHLVKVVAVIGIIAVFAVLTIRGFNRSIESRRADVQNHLDISMGGIEPNAYAYMMYTVKNNSSSRLDGHRVTCIVNKIVDSKGSAIIIAPVGNPGPWRADYLAPGGGGDTNRCSFPDHIALNGPIICADMTMRIDYLSEVWPIQLGHKSARFVVARGNGHQWYQVSTSFPGNYCDGALSPIFSTDVPR